MAESFYALLEKTTRQRCLRAYEITPDDVFAAVKELREPHFIPKEFKPHHKIRVAEILRAVEKRHGRTAVNEILTQRARYRFVRGYTVTQGQVKSACSQTEHISTAEDARDASQVAIADAVALQYGLEAGVEHLRGNAVVDVR